MLAIILTGLTLLGLGALIRFLGSIAKIWGIIPAQTFALVTTWANRNTDFTKDGGTVGGTVENLLHGIPGKVLVRDPDPMKWRFEDGEEERSLLFGLLGVQWVGLFRALRLNKISIIRYGKEGGGVDEKEEIEAEDHEFLRTSASRFIFYSSSSFVRVKNAETAGVYALDWEFIVITERIFPLRSVLRVPDPFANLSAMVSRAVIRKTSLLEPEDFLSTTESAKNKRAVIKAIMSISKDAERELGLKITEVTLRSVSPEDKYCESLELEAKTRRENEAAVAIAEKDKAVGLLKNSIEADQVERVVMRIANNPGAIQVRALEAYRDNKTVKVYAPGGKLSQILPDLTDGE